MDEKKQVKVVFTSGTVIQEILKGDEMTSYLEGLAKQVESNARGNKSNVKVGINARRGYAVVDVYGDENDHNALLRAVGQNYD